MSLLTSAATRKVELTALCNTAAPQGLIGMANTIQMENDWIQIAPYGNYPHSRGMQKVDRAAGEKLANNFNGMLARMSPRFFGAPIYIGHPDKPELKKDFPDNRAYGWVKRLEARADGVYAQTSWSEAGLGLVNSKHYLYVSPHWNAETVGQANGKPIFHPAELVSVGLTNQPNLPVMPLTNEAEPGSETEDNKGHKDMTLAQMIALLGLANEATEEQVTTEVNRLKATAVALVNAQAAQKGAETALANERTAFATEKTGLTNQVTTLTGERDAARARVTKAIPVIVAAAISQGKATVAQKEALANELTADFDGKLTALENTKAGTAMHTASVTGDLGTRKATSLVNVDFNAKAQGLVNTKMKDGMSYHDAWLAVKAENASLFEQAQVK